MQGGGPAQPRPKSTFVQMPAQCVKPSGLMHHACTLVRQVFPSRKMDQPCNLTYGQIIPEAAGGHTRQREVSCGAEEACGQASRQTEKLHFPFVFPFFFLFLFSIFSCLSFFMFSFFLSFTFMICSLLLLGFL